MKPRCECGRPAIAFVNGRGPKARAKGYRVIPGHYLCLQCWRQQAELRHARAKFPDNKTNFTALVEEVGELAESLLKKQTANIFAEAVQVIVMALRVIQEPDETHDVTLSYEDYKAFKVNKDPNE